MRNHPLMSAHQPRSQDPRLQAGRSERPTSRERRLRPQPESAVGHAKRATLRHAAARGAAVFILATLSFYATHAQAAVSSLTMNTPPFERPPAAVSEQYKRIAASAPQLQAFEARVASTARGLVLDRSSPTVLSFERRIGVYFPMRGGAGRSFVGLWFNEHETAPSVIVAGLFTLDPSGNIAVKFELNGHTVLDVSATPAGGFLRGTAYEEMGGAKQLTGWLSSGDRFVRCWNDCLSNLGLPGWLKEAIALACAASCAASKGQSCTHCLPISAGILVAQAAICAYQCRR